MSTGKTDCSGLYQRSEGIPRYTNASMTVFVPEGTVVATGGRFFLNVAFLVDKLCTKIKHQKYKKPSNRNKNAKIL